MTSDEVLAMVRERLREGRNDYFEVCEKYPGDEVGQAYLLGLLQGLELVEMDLTGEYKPLE